MARPDEGHRPGGSEKVECTYSLSQFILDQMARYSPSERIGVNAVEQIVLHELRTAYR